MFDLPEAPGLSREVHLESAEAHLATASIEREPEDEKGEVDTRRKIAIIHMGFCDIPATKSCNMFFVLPVLPNTLLTCQVNSNANSARVSNQFLNPGLVPYLMQGRLDNVFA